MQGAVNRNIEKEYSFTLINKYFRIADVIAEGGFGHIFYGEDIDGVPKAIKVIDTRKIKQTKNQKLIKQLEQEHQAMKVCNNPYVMKCEYVLSSEEQEIMLIIMDYCEYGSLEDLIYLRGRIPEEEAKIILKQILYALGDFHRHRRIHRDIKPANFVGKGDSIILCDFGCSKLFTNIEQNGWRKTFRQSGTITGTSCYMSPEMLKGDDYGEYGFRTDIWGVGLVFYEMLTGTFPFRLKKNGLSRKQIRETIESNISKIFDAKYISKKLQEEQIKLEPNQCQISPGAKKFLKRLLAFEEQNRIKWQQLMTHQYLINESVQEKCFQRSSCMFPLKNISWAEKVLEFKNELSQICFESPKKKQIPEKPILFFSKEKLDKQTKLKILKKSQNQYDSFINNITINRELHFEVRRIILLMECRYLLTQLKPQKITLGLAITKFAAVRLKNVINEYKKKLDPLFFDSHDLPTLEADLEEYLLGDLNDYKGKDKGMVSKTIKVVSGTLKIPFKSKQSKKREKDLLESMELKEVCEILVYEAKKFCKDCQTIPQVKQKKFRNLYQLIANPLSILCYIYRAQVIPEIREPWKKWQNIREIRKNRESNILSPDPDLQTLIDSFQQA